jgi:glycosyltransferase involved in cell wall biosynthesis
VDTAARIVFWAATAFLAYTYAGYPLLTALWARTRQRRVRKKPITPRVSLVVAAYNEAAGIGAKIENLLAIDYPKESLEVLVASDGSTDGTDAIVARYAPRGVQLLSLPRRGKLHALDAAVNRTRGDILVFSDANTHFDPQALRLLVRNFADPEVGGVCGNQRHVKRRGGDTSGDGERLYWSYDKALKALESRCGSIVAADGAIYAIRRSLYQRPPHAAATDDFVLSTAVIEQGARLVYEPEAVAWENATDDARGEFSRKVRIVTRGWRGIILRRQLLDPRRSGFYAVVLWSHKVFRRLAPVALVALFVSSLLAARHGPVYAWIAAAQLAFYALAVLGALLRGMAAGRHRGLYAPFFFVLANAAALVALLQMLRGRRIESWQPQRPVSETPSTTP